MRGLAWRLREKFSERRGFLLDSSYLLPIFSIDIDLRFTLKDILRAGEPVYYNPVSLVEIKWVLYKLVRKGYIDMAAARKNYIKGLGLLLRDKRLKSTPLTTPGIERVADILHDLGINDYFDRLIAATSIVGRLKLLTDDRELLNIEAKYREYIRKLRGN